MSVERSASPEWPDLVGSEMQTVHDGRTWAELFVALAREQPGFPFDVAIMTDWFDAAIEAGEFFGYGQCEQW